MEAISPIRILPEHLIDQIKAGEVIEGPASLIKELVENSIDAKSTKISIHVENNGLDLISVEDNGIGINMEDLPLAFGRHATSKISRFEDLYNLLSFGFRGEALASIASIARISAFSKPHQGCGGKITYHGGKLISHFPFDPTEPGTSIFVRDLFFNTPVRFKFIKSKNSEKSFILRIINSFIISNPNIHFSIKWDDKDKSIFPPSSSSERILKVLPKGDYKEINGEYEGYLVQGLVSLVSSKGNTKNNQFLFANNRLFSDKALHSAITRAMEGIWNLGETGNYCLFLKINPENLDVNVHPRKTELRFLQSSLVFSLVQSSIKNAVKELKKSEIKTIKGLQNLLEENLLEKKELNDPTPLTIFKIAENFIIFPWDRKYLLIDISLLLLSYLRQNLKPLTEPHIIPLIIGEPYPLMDKSTISILRKYGFQFEKIDEDQMILLTIPNYFSDLPFRKIIGKLISYFEKNKTFTTLLSKNDLNLEEINLSFFQIKVLIKQFEDKLTEEKFIVELDKNKLKSLFNSK